MAEILIQAEKRSQTGKNANRRLRQSGHIPAVLYGSGQETVHLEVTSASLRPVLGSLSGSTSLFDLDVSGNRHKVIIKETQIEPVMGNLLHVDFYEVALDKPIQLLVRVELTGTPVGVKTQGGILDFITRTLEVECLPTAIPEKIVVDVTELEIGKHLRVAAIAPPPGVSFVTDAEVVVAHVVARREEAAPEAEPVVAEAEAAEPEVIKKGKPATEAATTSEEK
jgi:large subunit ribosomal protein L25